ncbi:MAG: OmpA family protein [Acidobacteriota bacterium]
MRFRDARVHVASIIMALAFSLLMATGCATKQMVRDGAAATGGRLDDVETQVENNQRALREADRRLDDVTDQSRAARNIGRQAETRAEEALELAKGKLLYEVVLDDTAGRFALDSAGLSDDTRARLDHLAGKLKSENASVFLEIAGHTDSTGPAAYNMRLGLARAEAVRRYLNGQHEIPLHRMSVISYGETQPVADNKTKDGRARNRRVEIRVLS